MFARRGFVALAVIVVSAVVLAMQGPVGAVGQPAPPVQHNPKGKFLGIVHTTNTPRNASGTALTPPLVYHNGPVMHSSKPYAIFWRPPGYYLPAGYLSTIDTYFADVAQDSFKTTNVYASDTQYYDITSSVKHFISYTGSFGGGFVDSRSLPANGCPNYQLGDGSTSKACLTDAQIQNEVNAVVFALGSATTGLGAEIFLFTPPGLATCFSHGALTSGGCYDPSSSASNNTGGFCAYHSHVTGANPVRLYALMGFDAVSGCSSGQFPNGDDADPTISVTSHEHNETITDPLGTAWFDSSGNENGDECNFNFGGSLGFNGFGNFNQVINTHDYYLQQEYSNRAGGCVQKNTFVQPTASFTWSGTVHGSPTQFTTTVADSDDTAFTYSWTLGDGATSTLKNPTHTYSTAGTKTVTLIVFDAHGDQVRVIHSVVIT